VLGWGLAGIAFGIAVGSTTEAVLLAVLLRRRIPAFDPSPIVRVGAPAAAASLLAGVVAAAILAAVDTTLAGLPTSLRSLVELVLCGGAGGLAYLALARVSRLPELGLIMRLMSDTLSRLRPG
jgi:peptidoglycan biosynthesis protein MviN/MurJ (putative lipid II flippase)